jgi:hypothetical protein
VSNEKPKRFEVGTKVRVIPQKSKASVIPSSKSFGLAIPQVVYVGGGGSRWKIPAGSIGTGCFRSLRSLLKSTITDTPSAVPKSKMLLDLTRN